MRRWLALGAAIAAVTIGILPSSHADASAPDGSGASDGPAAPPLVPVAPGCPPNERADVTFVGSVVDRNETATTVRFEIEQLRAGSASPWAVDGLIDIRYGPDHRFLDDGTRYLVGAAFDSDFGTLASAVRPPEPLFGGNDVVGLNDTDSDCPTVESGVRTLQPDGSSVDSGVLSLMTADKWRLARTIVIPVGITFAVLLALVVLRWVGGLALRGVLELGRSAVTPVPDHRALRTREHSYESIDPTVGSREPAANFGTNPTEWVSERMKRRR